MRLGRLAILSLVHLVVDGYGTFIPALWVVIQDVFELSGLQVGLFLGLGMLPANVLQPFYGMVDQRFARWFVVLGPLLAVVCLSMVGLASSLTVLIMLGVSAYVVAEAIGRIGEEPEVQTGAMLVVGLIGLVVIIVSMLLLRLGAAESLNVRGAYFEVVSDAAGSVGVIIAGLLVAATGNGVWDTIVALGIGIFVAVRAIILGRQVLTVLGQHIPEGMRLDEVVADLEAVAGVADIHDLHIWTLTSGMNVATAHLVVDEGVNPQTVLVAAQHALAERHHIEHATLQVEAVKGVRCHELGW